MRHRWFHPREHVYICVRCGTGKVNALKGGVWQTTYHTPDGKSAALSVTPPCETGPLTAKYIGKYSEQIVRDEPQLLK